MNKRNNLALIGVSLAGILAGATLSWGGCWAPDGATTCSTDCVYACGPTMYSSNHGSLIPDGDMLEVPRCRTYTTAFTYACSPVNSPPPGQVYTGCNSGGGVCCGHSATDPGVADPIGLMAKIPKLGGYPSCQPPENG